MARTGFEMGRVGGIRIRAHVSFLLVLPFLAWILARAFEDAARAAGIAPELIAGPRWAWGLGLTVGLFVSVLLHELAHCWALIRSGGRVGSITLLMIGGVTEMTAPPRDPAREAGIALAGPATSLLLGAAAAALSPLALRLGWPGGAFALFYLGRMNVVLGLFNLLPAFPMDGGRILRGVLARRRSAVEATRIAARLGKAFAVLFAAVGLVSANLILLLVAFFVFVGAQAEEQAVLVRAVLGDLHVRDIMTAGPSVVAPDDTLFDVADRMLRERRVALPVSEAGGVLGFVRLEDVKRLPAEVRRATRVREAMRPAATVGPGDRVVDAIRLLGTPGVDHLAVVHDGTLVGVVSSFDFSRALQLGELAASQHAH
jgi:Zn-dependent protease/CBS domain-containing protein